MKVRLGIWHDEVAVFFARYLPEEYAVELDLASRELRIIKGGSHVMYHDPCDDSRMGYPWRIDAPDCDREGFSRCCLMEVALTEHANGWSAVLPPNHMLPWPHARDCLSYSRADELMRECVVRRDSARDAGEPMPPPPAGVQRELTSAMRVALFS